MGSRVFPSARFFKNYRSDGSSLVGVEQKQSFLVFCTLCSLKGKRPSKESEMVSRNEAKAES